MTFIKTMLAVLLAFSLVDTFGARVLFNFIAWLLASFWWSLGHILIPLLLFLTVLSFFSYLKLFWWRPKLAHWELEKEQTSRMRRVGE